MQIGENAKLRLLRMAVVGMVVFGTVITASADFSPIQLPPPNDPFNNGSNFNNGSGMGWDFSGIPGQPNFNSGSTGSGSTGGGFFNPDQGIGGLNGGGSGPSGGPTGIIFSGGTSPNGAADPGMSEGDFHPPATTQVPVPGAALMGLIGLGLVSRMRRRMA